ncbi:MAG: hypothetical protein HFG29_07960 [Eubacterium sp.]|nr:hypothetical protein [Eubacterium sp.]
MKKVIKSLVVIVAFVAMMFAMAFTTMAVDSITPTKSVTGRENAVKKTYTITQQNRIEGTYYYGYVIPVTVSEAGTLEIKVDVIKLDKGCEIDLYTDAELKNVISGSYITLSQGETKKTKYISLSNKGTYYLFVTCTDYTNNPAFTDTLSFSTRLFTNGDRTIKSGQTITYYRNNGSDNYYFKYKAEKTGKVIVTLPHATGSYVTLMNSKKKALSEKEWVSSAIGNFKFTFAVKKGATYYFLVNSNGTAYGNLQSITVKNTAVKAKAGSKKSKAVNIKYNKKAKCLVVPGDKKAKWYKFTLKKGKKPETVFEGNVTGSVKVQVLNKKGKVISTNTWYGGKSSLKSWGNWTKGTYYIKITRSNSLSSGIFTIKNKQVKK